MSLSSAAAVAPADLLSTNAENAAIPPQNAAAATSSTIPPVETITVVETTDETTPAVAEPSDELIDQIAAAATATTTTTTTTTTTGCSPSNVVPPTFGNAGGPAQSSIFGTGATVAAPAAVVATASATVATAAAPATTTSTSGSDSSAAQVAPPAAASTTGSTTSAFAAPRPVPTTTTAPNTIKPKSILKSGNVAIKQAKATKANEQISNWILKSDFSKAQVKVPKSVQSAVAKAAAAAIPKPAPSTTTTTDSTLRRRPERCAKTIAIKSVSAMSSPKKAKPSPPTAATINANNKRPMSPRPDRVVAAKAAFGLSPASSKAALDVKRRASLDDARRRSKLIAHKSAGGRSMAGKTSKSGISLSKAKAKSKAKAAPPKKSPTTRKAKTAPKSKAKKAATTRGTGSLLVWEGVAGDEVKEKQMNMSWKGWTKKTFERQSGKSKGSHDSYWYTPKKQYKLRSMNEIRRFMQAMETSNKDEDAAWAAFKGKTS